MKLPFFSFILSSACNYDPRTNVYIRQDDLQISDPSLPDSGGDGLHSRADGVQQVSQLTCAMGLPALLQNKPGEGQNVGVEGSSVRHLAVRLGTGTLCLKW